MGQRDVTPFKESMKSEKGLHAGSMCRPGLDSAVSVLKKEVESGQGDAPSSARYGQDRGAKRKLSECEDPALDLPYPQQRQLVLDLCLDKLQSCQRHAEPSLHRSVLLSNTLRQIQREMRLEGLTCLPPPSPPAMAFSPAVPRHVSELSSIDRRPHFGTPSLGPASGEDAEGPSRPDEMETRPSDSLFGSFEITNSTGYLTDLPLDDIFDDIDTSMYDPSDISVLAVNLPRGSCAASAVGDDGLKCFSCPPGSALQLCLADVSDLDHIMEILVRS